eukprot:1158342-Pelagomonas_calceolata.AAC.3
MQVANSLPGQSRRGNGLGQKREVGSWASRIGCLVAACLHLRRGHANLLCIVPILACPEAGCLHMRSQVLQHTGTAQQLLVPPTDKATSCYVPPTHPQNKAAANPLSRPQQQHPAATVLVRPQAFQLRGASLNACGLWPA